jgi:DNA-directed RNA polymerase subunit RPC12/RpoP
MEGAKAKISKNEPKTVSLVGKCGKCGRSFEADVVLPLIVYFDEDGNDFKDLAAPHFVVNCPYCFSLLNLALRTGVRKRRRYV